MCTAVSRSWGASAVRSSIHVTQSLMKSAAPPKHDPRGAGDAGPAARAPTVTNTAAVRSYSRGARAAVVFVVGLVASSVCRAARVEVPLIHDVLAAVKTAREAGEELLARGAAAEAVDVLAAAEKRWRAHEHAFRSAVGNRETLQTAPARWRGEDASGELLAVAFEDAQHAAMHLKATLGSALVEAGDARAAVGHLGVVCPSLWFYARRNGPGEEHIRGEVTWLRCYGDLIAARRALGEDREVAVLERDVVTHSTQWLRKKRDERPIDRARREMSAAAAAGDAAATADAERRLARRRYELEIRWPRASPFLRRGFGSGQGDGPGNAARAARNSRRVATLRWLSELSALSAPERRETARDYGRALARARAVRVDVDALVRAYVDADDSLARSRHLGKLRDAATEATAAMLPPEDGAAGGAADEEAEETLNYRAGVALAALLKTSGAEKLRAIVDGAAAAEQNATDAAASDEDAPDAADPARHSRAYLALADAFFGDAPARPQFGRAFARLVADEVRQYVTVVGEVHAHGWDWIQEEVARLEEDQRRCSLAISPVAGPPPGFLSRFDVIHVVAQHRQESNRRAQEGRAFGARAPRSSRRRREAAPLLDPTLAFVLGIALCALRGSQLLRERRRANGDGYARRRPKRSLSEHARDVVGDFLLALAAFAANYASQLRALARPAVRRAGPFKRRVAAAAAAVAAAVDRAFPATADDDESDDESDDDDSRASAAADDAAAPAPKKVEKPAAPEKPRAAAEKKKPARAAPAKRPSAAELEAEAAAAAAAAEAANATLVAAAFADCDASDGGDADEWLPVPKGGRVVAPGPRIVEASARTVTPPLTPPAALGSPKAGQPVESLLEQTRRAAAAADEAAKRLAAVAAQSCAVSVTSSSSSSSSSSGAPPSPGHAAKKAGGAKAAAAPKKVNPLKLAGRTIKKREPRLPKLPSTGAGDDSAASPSPSSSPRGVDGASRDRGRPAAAPKPARGGKRGAGRGAPPPAYADPYVDEALRTQVEYYFSVSNLCKDVYLRTNCMDGEGYVDLDHVCAFGRVRAICGDKATVRRAVEGSDKLDVRLLKDDRGGRAWKVRTNDHPERWCLASPAGAGAARPP